MRNISESTLKQIENQIADLLTEVEKAVDWSDKFLKGENRKTTNDKVKSIRRELKKIKYAMEQNPSAALYGVSQVGKSYLIKNLLSEKGKPFTITDRGTGKKYDFLREINPEGKNTEATSIVTRFSSKVNIVNDKYPILIKLLSPKDIVLILCDTYFSDLKSSFSLPENDINDEIINIQEIANKSSVTQSIIIDDDMYEIKEYLIQHFPGRGVRKFLESESWNILTSIIHKVSYHNWVNIFQLLWSKNEYISNVFVKLIDKLSELEFEANLYTNFKTVLRKHGTLLHVFRLHELSGEETYADVKSNREQIIKKASVINVNSDKTYEINKSILCALTAELVFEIDKKLEIDKKFLETSDLLDFPGARSRKNYNENDITPSYIGEMVLRGKVSYIFNKFSSQYLISNLLFCNKDMQMEVKYIPDLLNSWITNYIGSTPQKRQEFLKDTPYPPLFIIYTFFNNDLVYDSVNDRVNNQKSENTLGAKWEKRFITIFKKEIVTKSHKWLEEWTTEEPFFKNNYMLRDYVFSKGIYSGYDMHKKEIDEVAVPIDNYMEELKKSFIKFPFVRKHFENPTEAWNESATLNQDGSEPIIRNLTQVSNNYARTHKFIRELNELSDELNRAMNRHYHSDESDQRIAQANRKGGKVQKSMDIIFGKDAYAFSNFIKAFLIKESDVYNFYREMIPTLEMVDNKKINEIIIIRQANKELNNFSTYEEKCQVLMKTYQFESIEALEEDFAEEGLDLNEIFFGEKNQIKNNSTTLAEALRDNWFEHYLVKERFQQIIDLGFNATSLEHLFDNIKVCFDRQGLDKIIAKNIREYVDRFDRIDVAEEMISDISASLINKFITSMAWDFYTPTELENIKQTNAANNLGLNFDFYDEAFHYLDNDDMISELFDNMDAYEEHLGKVTLDHKVIKKFPYIDNLSRWRDYMRISFVANCDIPTYDILANNELGKLLENIESYNFTLVESNTSA